MEEVETNHEVVELEAEMRTSLIRVLKKIAVSTYMEVREVVSRRVEEGERTLIREIIRVIPAANSNITYQNVGIMKLQRKTKVMKPILHKIQVTPILITFY